MTTMALSSYQRRVARVRADRERIIREFHEAVNMTARRLQAWLDTDESHEVGWRRAPAEESVGHQSGRQIVRILRTLPAKLTDEDLLHMRAVVGYIRRHLAQRPFKEIATSRWAYSLKNWGHDPTKNMTILGASETRRSRSSRDRKSCLRHVKSRDEARPMRTAR